MNIFTNDDYRRIQAWLKANAIKDSDFTISENTVPDEDILVITQNVSTVPTNYKIKIKDLLNSSLGKIVIDKITANVVKVNNTLTVDAANVKLDNEKGTTLQDIIDWTETLEKAAKEWKIEYQVPSIDEPTVRAKYVLKDSKGVPKGDVIKVYKDSAITNVYLGTTKDTCNENTGEVTKKPVQDNNEALSIVYRLDTGKYSLVNVPIGIFTREAEFDKYKGLGVTENGQVFVKLASDVESTNYLHFNDMGEVSADGIENRILQDLGTIINSVANDGTMWGQYKKEEGTKDSPINEASRWGQYKQAEADRSGLLNIVSSKVNQLEQEQIQGGVYDVSTHNDGAVFESLQAILSSPNLSTLIPTSVRHGGMSIRFVQSSDNKYVQYRLTTNEWSTNTEDWAIYSESVYVENPEFVDVKTDAEGKILWAIKTDGSIYYGAGVPSQIIDYINKKIAELSLDEYKDIVAFLNGLEEGDKTLQILLNEKIDKVEGKSLIDEEYADGIRQIESQEFAEVHTDADDNILYGVKQDGDFYFGAGVPSQIQEEIDNKVNNKVDKEEGKSLIDSYYASSQSVINNSEYLQAITDSENKIIEGITGEGVKQVNAPIDTPSVAIDHVDNKEWTNAVLDEKNKVVSGRKVNGVLVENIGIESPTIEELKVRISEQEAPTSILSLNPKAELLPVIKNYKHHQVNETGDGTPIREYQNLSLVWFSDIHSDGEELRRIVNFYNCYEEYLDGIICTGDVVAQTWKDDFSYWHKNGGDKVLFVNGNHDTYTPIDGSIKTYYSAEAGYKRYIEPFLSATNLTESPINKMYWVKDFPESKIRLIAVDVMHLNEKYDYHTYEPVRESGIYPDGGTVDNGEQLTWFISKLNEVKNTDWQVICTAHFPAYRNTDNFIKSTFSIIPFKQNLGGQLQEDYQKAVSDFIDDGGNFICWMCGHHHEDEIFLSERDNRQLCVVVDCCQRSLGYIGTYGSDEASYQSIIKPKYTKAQDSFNIINVEPRQHFLRMYRVGTQYDGNNRRIGSIVYDYLNKTLIYN